VTAYTMTATLAQVDVMAQTASTDITDASRQAAIRAALEHYSRDFPRTYTDDYTGDGGKYYILSSTTLTGWSEDFSNIIRIEYPAATIASDELPQYLDRDDWQDDYFAEASTARVRYLLLPNHAPASTESMRITYTVPYTFATPEGGSEQMDIPAQHFYAFCNLAASHVCRAVASKFSKIGDSTFDVDSASHTTKAQEFSIRAKELEAFYRNQMSLPADGATGTEAAAGVFLDWKTSPSAGRGWLYHRR